MTTYRYRAAAADGKIVQGMLQSPTREGALQDLRARSLFPVVVEESADVPDTRRARRAPGLTQFTRSLATLMGAGFPVDRALGVSADLAEQGQLRGIIQAVRQDVRGGRSLAEAFAAHPRTFPPLYIAMVRAGEAGGTLGATFGRLADLQEEAAELRGQVVSALLYPALMLVAGGLAVGLLVFLVVPRFAGVLTDSGASLPWTTRVLIGSVDIVVGWGWLFALLAGVGVALAVRAVRTPAGRLRWDGALLRVPIAGDLLLRIATARLTRTLGTLLESGIPLVSALEIARNTTGNEALRRGLSEAGSTLRQGQTLSTSVGPLLPRLARQMIAVGEESGSLSEMLLRVAGIYDQEVRSGLKRAVTLVEPVLILVFGAVVGFVALGMLQAIYSINTGSF